MSNYNKYPKYLDSGVEWLGEIPEHWSVLPGLNFMYENKVKNTGMKRSQVLSLSYGSIRVKREDELTGLVPESFETYQLVDKGDIIFRPTDLQNDKVSLRSGIASNKGIITSAYINLKIKSKANNVFYSYVFRAIDNNKVIYGLGTGLRQNISYNDFRRFLFPFPPLKEQQAIANFLDKKTEAIDKAIAQKEKLITLLKERKQIIIQNAVTKGLDKDVKLVDSGIEWIGDIPEHWEVKKFRFLFSFSKGLNITKENLQDEGIPCVNYGEIHSKYGFDVDPKKNPLKCVDSDYLKHTKSILKYGDFVFADTSEDVEGSGNFTYLNSKETVFAGYHTVIARQLESHHPRFLAYAIDSDAYRNQIRKRVKGVKVYSITNTILKDTFLWLPSSDDQVAIVEYCDKVSSRFDKAIALQQSQIEKLKEYKASLIDSAVTGKIKVI